jgi:hypothetical protein
VPEYGQLDRLLAALEPEGEGESELASRTEESLAFRAGGLLYHVDRNDVPEAVAWVSTFVTELHTKAKLLGHPVAQDASQSAEATEMQCAQAGRWLTELLATIRPRCTTVMRDALDSVMGRSIAYGHLPQPADTEASAMECMRQLARSGMLMPWQSHQGASADDSKGDRGAALRHESDAAVEEVPVWLDRIVSTALCRLAAAQCYVAIPPLLLGSMPAAEPASSAPAERLRRRLQSLDGASGTVQKFEQLEVSSAGPWVHFVVASLAPTDGALMFHATMANAAACLASLSGGAHTNRLNVTVREMVAAGRPLMALGVLCCAPVSLVATLPNTSVASSSLPPLHIARDTLAAALDQSGYDSTTLLRLLALADEEEKETPTAAKLDIAKLLQEVLPTPATHQVHQQHVSLPSWPLPQVSHAPLNEAQAQVTALERETEPTDFVKVFGPPPPPGSPGSLPTLALDVEYLLRCGRPAAALNWLGRRYSFATLVSVPAEAKHAAERAARLVALTAATQASQAKVQSTRSPAVDRQHGDGDNLVHMKEPDFEAVVAGCVVLLAALGLPSAQLRADAAAQRLLSIGWEHGWQPQRAASGMHEASRGVDKVLLTLGTPNEQPGAAAEILGRLEALAASQTFNAEDLPTGQTAWDIVSAFATAHAIGPSCGRARLLARKGDWLQLLCEAEAQGLSLAQLIDVVRGMAPSDNTLRPALGTGERQPRSGTATPQQVLRAHLLLWLRQLQARTEPQSLGSAFARATELASDNTGCHPSVESPLLGPLAAVLLECERRPAVTRGAVLLDAAVEAQQPLLALIAQCPSTVTSDAGQATLPSSSLCMLSFICARVPELQQVWCPLVAEGSAGQPVFTARQGEHSDMDTSQLAAMAGAARHKRLVALAAAVPAEWELLQQALVSASTSQALLQVCEAWSVFAPAHPLASFFDAAHAFVQRRYAHAAAELQAFLRQLSGQQRVERAEQRHARAVGGVPRHCDMPDVARSRAIAGAVVDALYGQAVVHERMRLAEICGGDTDFSPRFTLYSLALVELCLLPTCEHSSVPAQDESSEDDRIPLQVVHQPPWRLFEQPPHKLVLYLANRRAYRSARCYRRAVALYAARRRACLARVGHARLGQDTGILKPQGGQLTAILAQVGAALADHTLGLGIEMEFAVAECEAEHLISGEKGAGKLLRSPPQSPARPDSGGGSVEAAAVPEGGEAGNSIVGEVPMTEAAADDGGTWIRVIALLRGYNVPRCRTAQFFLKQAQRHGVPTRQQLELQLLAQRELKEGIVDASGDGAAVTQLSSEIAEQVHVLSAITVDSEDENGEDDVTAMSQARADQQAPWVNEIGRLLSTVSAGTTVVEGGSAGDVDTRVSRKTEAAAAAAHVARAVGDLVRAQHEEHPVQLQRADVASQKVHASVAGYPHLPARWRTLALRCRACSPSALAAAILQQCTVQAQSQTRSAMNTSLTAELDLLLLAQQAADVDGDRHLQEQACIALRTMLELGLRTASRVDLLQRVACALAVGGSTSSSMKMVLELALEHQGLDAIVDLCPPPPRSAWEAAAAAAGCSHSGCCACGEELGRVVVAYLRRRVSAPAAADTAGLRSDLARVYERLGWHTRLAELWLGMAQDMEGRWSSSRQQQLDAAAASLLSGGTGEVDSAETGGALSETVRLYRAAATSFGRDGCVRRQSHCLARAYLLQVQARQGLEVREAATCLPRPHR